MVDRRLALIAGTLALPLAGCAQRSTAVSSVSGVGDTAAAETAAQVRAAELSFADTMARRDLAAFGEHISANAVFLGGGKPLRGRAAIVAGWSRFFQAPTAPFAWAPETIEVLQPGRFGFSEGPVTNAAGVGFARFYSVWHYEPDGRWRVVLDNGYDICKG